ncbi:hypothetical protein LTR66_015720, partial [Elasticomyces elasticus]
AALKETSERYEKLRAEMGIATPVMNDAAQGKHVMTLDGLGGVGGGRGLRFGGMAGGGIENMGRGLESLGHTPIAADSDSSDA